MEAGIRQWTVSSPARCLLMVGGSRSSVVGSNSVLLLSSNSSPEEWRGPQRRKMTAISAVVEGNRRRSSSSIPLLLHNFRLSLPLSILFLPFFFLFHPPPRWNLSRRSEIPIFLITRLTPLQQVLYTITLPLRPEVPNASDSTDRCFFQSSKRSGFGSGGSCERRDDGRDSRS